MKLVLALQGTPRPGPAPHPGRTSRTTTPRRGTAGSKALHRENSPFSYVECSAGRLARAFLGGNFEKRHRSPNTIRTGRMCFAKTPMQTFLLAQGFSVAS